MFVSSAPTILATAFGLFYGEAYGSEWYCTLHVKPDCEFERSGLCAKIGAIRGCKGADFGWGGGAHDPVHALALGWRVHSARERICTKHCMHLPVELAVSRRRDTSVFFADAEAELT